MNKWPDLYNVSFNRKLSQGEASAIEGYLNTKYPGWDTEDLKTAINQMSESGRFDGTKPTVAEIGAEIRSIQVLSNIGHCDCQICGKEQFKTTRKKPYGWIPYQWGSEDWEVEMVPCLCEKGKECLERSYEVKHQHGISLKSARAVNQIEQKSRHPGKVQNKHGAEAFVDICEEESAVIE